MNPQDTIVPISQYHLAPQTGIAFTVQKGQIIRVIDIEGQQVADLVCFARQNAQEYLSSGRSLDYIDLQTEMDLIIAVSACSAGKCNNFRCTPIRVEIYPIKEQN